MRKRWSQKIGNTIRKQGESSEDSETQQVVKMEKMDTYYEVWACSLLLLLVNFWAMFEIIKSYRWDAMAPSPTTRVKAE